VINWVVCDEYIRGRGYQERAWKKLSSYGIEMGHTYPSVIKNQIASGKRLPSFPTNFSTGMRSRYHKDVMYGELWRLADVVLQHPTYIGLPAYNVECVRRRLGNDITMVERDADVLNWVWDFYEDLMKQRQPEYVEGNIWSHLTQRVIEGGSYKRYNLFDLDLMMGITPGVDLDMWAKLIYWNSQPTAVVGLVTTVGRINSYATYQQLMPHFLISSFREAGFKHVKVYRGQYQDNKHPMMYEHFHLEK
tara:strand:- start:6186 stop:6929 length:744 start_codon:yes stop_codon:yes gene_type:complete